MGQLFDVGWSNVVNWPTERGAGMDETQIAVALGSWGGEPGPLYATLADALDEIIRAGRLEAGARLPAERRLAAELHVSRGTVVSAYDELRRRNRIATRQGSGTTVVDRHRSDEVAVFDPVPAQGGIYEGMLDHPVDEVVDMRSAYWIGVNDLPTASFELPAERWQRELQGTGYYPAGLPALREQIAARMTRAGLETEAHEVLVTNGAQQALALICQLHMAPDELCVIEELTYPGMIDLVSALRGRLHTVPIDEHGVDVERLDRAVRRVEPALVYLMPNVHNPTGAVFPEDRRAALADLVKGWDTFVIDDRTLVDLVVDRDPPRPLAIHPSGPLANVLTVGSTSKSLWGGLRIGWVRANEREIDRLSRLKAVMDLGIPIASQMIASELLPSDQGLSRVRQAELRRRRDALVDGLRRQIPEWRFEVPDGGVCLWVELPLDDARTFIAHAQRHGVGLVSGSVSSPDGRARHYLRLPFGQPVEVLADAVDRLAAAWADLVVRPVETRRYRVIV
jgi:DNA-binding transcriptional MocR family regulator